MLGPAWSECHKYQCFGSGYFFPDRDQTFFLSPDPDRPKIRPKTEVKVEKNLYFISSTLNTVLFGQAPPKPYQNHHLDSIRL